jgi:hypothetical protein
MAWGANFNFSIWFIELRGIMNPDIVSRAQIEYEQVRLRHSDRHRFRWS